MAEIARKVLVHDFRNIDPAMSRVLLLEYAPRVLTAYPEDLSRKAAQQLRNLGVEVRTGAMVTAIEPRAVMVGSEKIPASLVLWAAGVKASPLGAALGVTLDRAGRVIVQPDCSLPRHPEVFVIGDLLRPPAGTAIRCQAWPRLRFQWAAALSPNSPAALAA